MVSIRIQESSETLLKEKKTVNMRELIIQNRMSTLSGLLEVQCSRSFKSLCLLLTHDLKVSFYQILPFSWEFLSFFPEFLK